MNHNIVAKNRIDILRKLEINLGCELDLGISKTSAFFAELELKI